METGPLVFPRTLDAFTDGCGGLFRSGARDVAIFDRWHFDMEIDAIEERTGNALAITMDLGRAATALAFQVAEVSAGTGVHRGDEHEFGRERHAAGRPRDSDFSVFERMTVSALTKALQLRQAIRDFA
jgi:hypothetical protein